jgi:hypothetical protein
MNRNKILERAPEQSPANGHLTKVSPQFTPDAEFAAVVSRAKELKTLIDQSSTELDGLKVKLREGAQARLPAGKRRNPAGETITLIGINGERVNVQFLADKNIAAFWFADRDGQAWRYKDDKAQLVGPVRELAGDYFNSLFMKQFKPTKQFKVAVWSLVGQKHLAKKDGERLIELCMEPSTPKVEIA